jgi:hypothetical protein
MNVKQMMRASAKVSVETSRAMMTIEPQSVGTMPQIRITSSKADNRFELLFVSALSCWKWTTRGWRKQRLDEQQMWRTKQLEKVKIPEELCDDDDDEGPSSSDGSEDDEEPEEPEAEEDD